MALQVVHALHGANTVHCHDPAIEDHDDVVYVPMSQQAGLTWGIYGRNGRLIEAAALHRGPDHHLMMQTDDALAEQPGMDGQAPDDRYVYVGALHLHYGHFLLSSLSRFWHVPSLASSSVKLLYHAGDYLADWWTIPHVAFCLTQLGITADRFVRFDAPTRIRRLTIPRTSFEELHFAHDAFAALCNAIGSKGAASLPAGKADRSTPVYLSKTKLKSGVWRFTDEAVLEREFERCGFEIAYPEQLALAEQIRLFQERPVVVATTGSLIHTSVFAARCAPIVSLGFKGTLDSNYALADTVNKTRASYLHATEAALLGAGDGFTMNVRLADPKQVAADLLRHADALMQKPRPTRQAPSPEDSPLDTLNQIGLRHGTDKASFHHDFLAFYERFLPGLRQQPTTRLLEIGVYEGASLRMWEEYFQHGKVVGIDINPAAANHRTDRAHVEIADQSNVLALVGIAVKHGPFDVVVDDGSHFWDHQVTSLQALFPFVKRGGYSTMEDLDTSYGSHAPNFKGIATESTARYLHRICDYLVGNAVLDINQETDAFIRSFAPPIHSMSFYRRTCVIERKA